MFSHELFYFVNFVVNLVAIFCLRILENCLFVISAQFLFLVWRYKDRLIKENSTPLPQLLCYQQNHSQYWFHCRAQPELVPHLHECCIFEKDLGVINHYRSAECIKNSLPIVFLMTILCLQKYVALVLQAYRCKGERWTTF